MSDMFIVDVGLLKTNTDNSSPNSIVLYSAKLGFGLVWQKIQEPLTQDKNNSARLVFRNKQD